MCSLVREDYSLVVHVKQISIVVPTQFQINSVKNEDTPVGSAGAPADVATGIAGSVDNVSAS